MNYYKLDSKTQNLLKGLKGPIVVFGAGGFIGINLLKSMLLYRSDVFGISQDMQNNWRFIAAEIPHTNLRNCDLNDPIQIKDLIESLKPRTILNLAAYGAYSKQREYKKIYKTNIISTFDLIEILKERGFDAYLHVGSQSEYGTNSKAPLEDSELVPNSHYAVSKVTNYYTVKYYGKTEKLPVVHIRLYSAYGPWEEPDRLMPVLLSNARNRRFPKLVDPDISRDFIYVSDITSALIYSVSKLTPKYYGEAFNVSTGQKTTIKELAYLVRDVCLLKKNPVFGGMKNRKWDLKEWYGNSEKIQKAFGWRPKVTLREGLKCTIEWQKGVSYDTAFWNWMNKIRV